MTDIKRSSIVVRRSTRSAPPAITARGTTISIHRDSVSNQQVYADEFEVTMGNGLILPPPYDVHRLLQLIERSNMIPQCVEAYVVNIVLTGWEVTAATQGGKVDEGEKTELQSFIDYANSDESLSGVLANAVRDREYVGFGFIEIIRDRVGRISLLRHAPAIRTRLSYKHPDAQLVTYEIPRGRRTATVQEWRKFRRFVQIVQGVVTWFKEYGDPRKLNAFTGLFEGEPGYTDDCPATEILHIKNPSNDPYGTPRWVNQTPNIIGARESEEVNMRYFEDNTIPPLFLTVAGGRLTAASHKELKSVLAAGGKSKQHQVTLLEAVGESDSLDRNGTPIQLKVEKLTDARQSDGLFDKYDAASQAKVRSSFRLSPILVGMANDQTYDNAGTALFAAESQVFAPMRVSQDELLNRRFVNGKNGLNLRTVKLTSRTPAITSPEMIMKSLTALNVMGAITPRTARIQANATLQIEMPPYPEIGETGYEDWMDRPILFITKGVNPDGEQNAKDAATKAVEATGNVAPVSPENEAK